MIPALSLLVMAICLLGVLLFAGIAGSASTRAEQAGDRDGLAARMVVPALVCAVACLLLGTLAAFIAGRTL